jgi:replicative DNA helicase
MTILPYDHQSEADAIGCMVSNPAYLIEGMKQLHENDFTNVATRTIFNTMDKMFNEGIPVDETTVAARIPTKDRGPLRDAVAGAEDAEHFQDYLKILHDRRARREIRKSVENVMHSISQDEDATESLKILEQSAFTLRSKHSGKTKDNRHDTKELEEWFTDYLSEEWVDDNEYSFTHVMPSLQESLGYFGRGELGIIAGYSSDGKSVYALQQAAALSSGICGHHGIDGSVQGKQDNQLHSDVARGRTHSVGYYSLEMPERQVWRRLACHTGIPLKTIKQRTWNEAQARILREKAKQMKEWNFDVHSGSTTMAQIRADQMKHDYDVIFIDHMHRMSGSSDRIKLEEMIRDAKTLALDANCCVIALAQLARREGYPRPATNQLRGTEMLTAEADWVLFTYRTRDEEGRRLPASEIVVGKARDGEVDLVIPCTFNSNSLRFEEAGQYEATQLTKDSIAKAMGHEEMQLSNT